MVLETLHKDAPQNIKGLVLENPEPAPRLSFDPIRDISPQTWEDFLSENLILDANKLAHLFFLNPALRSRISEGDIEVAQFIAIGQIYNRHLRQRDLELMAKIKIIDPSLPHSKLTDSEQSQLQKEYEILADLLIQPNLGKMTRISKLAAATLCYPNEFPQQNINNFRTQLSQEFRPPSFQETSIFVNTNFIKFFSDLKIMFSVNPLELTNEDWKLMKEMLQKLEQERNWNSFLGIAYCMKILSAERVNITEQGLELIMPDPPQTFKADTPPLPEARRF